MLREYVNLVIESMNTEPLETIMPFSPPRDAVTFMGVTFYYDEDDNGYFTTINKNAIVTLLKRRGMFDITVKTLDNEFQKSISNVNDVNSLRRAIRTAQLFTKDASKRSADTAIINGDEYTELFGEFGMMSREARLFGSDTGLIDLVNKKFPGRLPNVGNEIGRGAEGIVYEYGDDRVLKVFLTDNKESARAVFRTLHWAMTRDIPCISKVFDAKYVGRFVRETMVGNPSYDDAMYVIYYVAERLYPPSEEPGLDVQKRMSACLKKHGINALDLIDNPDNIMVTSDGEYKVIDIGRFLVPL